MAAVTELTVKANIAELRKELGKIPGITATEAKAMAGQLVKESKKAGKAAEKAAKKSKAAWGGNTTAIGKAAYKMKGFGAAAKAAAVPLAAVGAGLVATGAAAFKLAKASSDLIDALSNSANKAGVSIEEFSAFGYTLNAAGSDSEKLVSAMAPMLEKMRQARNGSAEAAAAFGALGVKVEDADGNLRSSGAVLRDVASGLAGLSNDTDRAAGAMGIFGEGGSEVGLALASSLPMLEEFSAAASNMITPEALAASAAFDQAMARLEMQSDAAKIAIGTSLTPAIVDLMNASSAAAPELRDMFKDAVVYLNWFINGTRTAWAVVRDGADTFISIQHMILDGLLLPLRAVYTTFQELGKLAGIALPEFEYLDIERTTDGVEALSDKLKEIAGGSGHLSQVMASGWIGGKLAIGEVSTELDGVVTRLGKVEAAGKSATAAVKDNTDALVKQWLAAKAYGDEITQMVADDAKKQLEEHAAFVDNVLSHTASASGDIASIAGAWSQRLAEEGTEAAKEQARAAFAIAKAAALSQIVISTAIAAMNIQEKFAAVPPVAAALTAVLMGTSAANLALVATEQPSFHRGGMISPDEVSITAQKGEAVLSRSGVQAAGGESGVNALNSGGAGAGGVMIINQVYRHRVFDRVVSDSIKRTNSPLNKALNAGRRVGMSK
jgi:hypothetical protein